MNDDTNISDQKYQLNEDLKFLLGSEVRFAIISTIDAFKEPLSLSKLSIITGYPITTLIHHIPTLLKKEFILPKKIPSKRGKFYELSEKTLKILEFSDSETDYEIFFKELDESKSMSIVDYKVKILNLYSELIKTGKLNSIIADAINSVAMFNRNIANFSAEYLKKFIEEFQTKKSLEMDIPIAYISNFQMSFTFSSVSQLKEFQKIYLSFMKELAELKKKFDLENTNENESKLEKAYLYLFTAPIINFSD